MAVKKINSRIKNKRDLECNWDQAQTFEPLPGEIIIYSKELDKHNQIYKKADGSLALPAARQHDRAYYSYDRIKIGDGYSTVGALPFIGQPKIFSGSVHDTAAKIKYAQREVIFIQDVVLSKTNFSTTVEVDDFQLMPIGNKIQQIYKFTTVATTKEAKEAILKEATFTFNIAIEASEDSYIDCPILLVKPNLWLSGWTFDLTPNNNSTTFNSSSDAYQASANFKIHAPNNITCANTGSVHTNTAYVVRLTFEKIDAYTILVEPEFFITGVKTDVEQ